MVNRLTKLIDMTALAALAYLLALIAVPIIPVMPDLRLDLSDLPVLFGTVMLGLGSGIGIVTLKEFLYLLLTGVSLPNLMGGTLSWLASVSLLLSVWGVVKLTGSPSSWRSRIWLVGIATFNLTWLMILANWLLIPIYVKLVGLKVSLPLTKLLAFGVLPFNLIKGLLVMSLFLILINRIDVHQSKIK